MNIYECMNTPNVIENYGLLSADKKDVIGISTAFNTDIKLRGKVTDDILMRPYFRMRLLDTLCHIYDILPKGEWLCAIHTNDNKGHCKRIGLCNRDGFKSTE